MKSFLLLLLALPFLLKAQSFAVISDIHLEVSDTYLKDTSRRITISRNILENAVEKINQDEDIKFVLVCGDLIDKSRPWNLDSVKYILDQLQKDYFVVIGNNDFSSPRDGIGSSKSLFHYTFRENETGMGKFVWRGEPVAGVSIIGIDNISPVSGSIEWNPKLMQELQEALQASAGDNIIVLMHYPVVELDYFEPGEVVVAAEEFISMCRQYGVSLLIQGHYHYQEFQEIEGMLSVIVPALVEYPHPYMKLSLKQNAIETELVEVMDPVTTAESQKKLGERILELKRQYPNEIGNDLTQKIAGKRFYHYDKK